MIERAAVLARVNLVELVEGELGPPARQSGRWVFWRCPFHANGEERTASFGVTPDTGTYHCYGCGVHGDAISFVMERRKVGFVEACRELAPSVVDGPGAAMERGPEVRPAPPFSPALPEVEPPGEEWQARGWEFVERCQRALWERQGEQALAWLCETRGLQAHGVAFFRIGYNARTRYEARGAWGLEAEGSRRVWLPRGIVMPCWGDGALWSVKICRPEGYTAAGRAKGEKKYVKVAGSKGGLYGYEELRGERVLMIEEGEWNHLTIWQEAGGGSEAPLVDVLSSGSASVRPHAWRRWWGELAGYERVLVRMDGDEAGGRAWGAWGELLGARGGRVQAPSGGDPNGFLQGGGDVRGWVEWELARVGVSA